MLLLWARGGRRFDFGFGFGFGFGDGRGRRDGRTAATSEVVRLRLRVRRFAKVVLRERGLRVRRDLYTVYGGGARFGFDFGFGGWTAGSGSGATCMGRGEGGATSGSAVAAMFAVEIRRGFRFTKDCLNVCPSWGEEGGGRRGEEVRLRVRRGMRLRGDVGVGGSGSGSGVTAVEQIIVCPCVGFVMSRPGAT